MTFRIVDLITRLDGTRPLAYRMCDASGEANCPPPSEAVPVDTTPPPNDNDVDDNGQGGGASQGRNDAGSRNRNDQGGCGGGSHALPMLRARLRQSLQEPPASPW